MKQFDLERLGVDVRHAQDALLDARPLAPLPLRLPRRHAWPHVASASLAAVASAALVLVVVRFTDTPSEPSAVSHATAPPLAGSLTLVDAHGANVTRRLPLALQAMATLRASDGTVVVVDRGNATLRDLAADRGVIELTEGRLSMSLPRATTSSPGWDVRAGPWRVDARAVRVDVAHENDRLTVRVVGDGEAHVTGADGVRHVVVAGEERAWPEARGATALSVAAKTATSGAANAHRNTAASGDVSDGASTAPLVEDGDGPTWQEMARDDRHADAMNLARARGGGVDEILAHGSVDDLALLATSARLAASPDVARLALLAVRARAAGSAEAARAAFFLGVLADRAGDDEQALTFFARYAAEAPDGELAAQAMGRALEVGVRANKSVVDDARTYLRRWPNEAHAAFAARIVHGVPSSP